MRGHVNVTAGSGVCLIHKRRQLAARQEEAGMGFLSRLLVPRSVRRAAHPMRAVRRAVTPKVVKKATRALHPLDNAIYGIERSVATSLRSGQKRKQRKGRGPVYRHGSCPVAHRTPEAAAKCRNH
jgi:hypothetical protein